MATLTREKKMWVKEEIKKINELWKTETPAQLARILGVEYQQLNYIVMEMRKSGFDLPKKHIKGQIRTLLDEVKAELGK